jgi:hypothetical protein
MARDVLPMMPPKRTRDILRGGVLAILLLLGGSSAAPSPSPQAGGEAVSGLRMTINLDRVVGVRSKTPDFRIELRNVGENDLVLNLGVMLANGKRQFPNAVILTLTDAQGKSRRLDLRDPSFISGRVDPLIVPLPVGAIFSIPVNLDRYWAVASEEFDYKPKPGRYALEAQFTGRGVSQQEANLDEQGIALMPCWQGKVTSNLLRFDLPRP